MRISGHRDHWESFSKIPTIEKYSPTQRWELKLLRGSVVLLLVSFLHELNLSPGSFASIPWDIVIGKKTIKCPLSSVISIIVVGRLRKSLPNARIFGQV